MKNLEQVRAMNALEAAAEIQKHDTRGKGDKGGDAISGFPALIVNNGLLATLAFSKSKSGGYLVICDQIASHLSHPEIRLLNTSEGVTDGLLKHLTESDSAALRLCTAESLAFLNYLRRFVKAQD